MKKISLLRAVLVLIPLLACQRAGAGPAEALAALANSSAVTSLTIHNDWMGLSEFGPVGRTYLLKPSASGFDGTATFSLGGGEIQKTKSVPLAVTADAMKAFFAALARAPLQKGAYTPKIDHTDDYPSVQIDIAASYGPISFYSRSQGEDAVPWGAKIGGEEFTVASKEPMDAFRKLEPFLKEGELAKFMEEYRAQVSKQVRGR